MQFPNITGVDYLVVSVSIYLLVVLWDHKRRRGLPYPPGPRPWPIIGNLLDVPSRYPWAVYTEMSKAYGDVICFRILGQVVVVLSSSAAIKELLEKHGEIYSDRPPLPIHEVLGVDWLLPILPKDDVWSDRRKLLDRSLRPAQAASTSYRKIMEEKTRAFLSQLLVNPNDFRSHIGLLQGNLIMSLTYGYELTTYDDELIEAPVELNKILGQLVLPGAVLISHIPFIKQIHSWIPFLSFETMARKCRELSWKMEHGPVDFVRKSMQEGTALPSLAREHLRDIEHLSGPERERQEKIIQEALGSLFNAGSDTSVSSMVALFLALTLYPDVQRRAQAELDSVVGRDRLPTFEDRTRLPYIDAMCKELLRWRMVSPLGFPHASSQDHIFRGYFIPKGATILANAWGILHDPELYPDPERFNPERFLSKATAAAAAADPDDDDDATAGSSSATTRRPIINDPSALPLAFGAGRRICPGRHFVDATLFILAASVLAVYDVSKPKKGGLAGGSSGSSDESGATENGLICSPGMFGCSITPRDKLAQDLIAENVTMGD
ncbi:cytochrome P450 [Russula compacta]|nr:cytochrome P450 [Russula compacta]